MSPLTRRRPLLRSCCARLHAAGYCARACAPPSAHPPPDPSDRRWRQRYRQLDSLHPPGRSRPADHDALSHFAHFLHLNHHLGGGAAVASYLSTWFMGAPAESIRSENVEELFAYCFFYQDRWATGDGPVRALPVLPEPAART